MMPDTQGIPTLTSISELDSKNIKGSIDNFPTEAGLFDDLIKLYAQFSDALNSSIPDTKVAEYQLFWISLRGLFTASSLIFSAHIAEAYTIISRSAEAAGYANHIRKTPNKASVWITKPHDSNAFMNAFKPRWDGSEVEKVKRAYKLTRDYGVHSNLSSTVFHQIKQKTSEGMQNVYTDIGNIKNLHRCMVYVLYSYEAITEIFALSFDELLSPKWKQDFSVFQTKFEKHLESLKEYFTDHSDLEI